MNNSTALFQNNVHTFSFKAAGNLYTPGQNLVYSPASLNTALGLLLEATGGLTQKEIINAVIDPRFNGDVKNEKKASDFLAELGRGHKDGIRKLVSDANFAYFNKSVIVRESYVKSIKEKYGATIGHFDSSNPNSRAAATKTINNDVKRVTRGLISELLKENAIDRDTSALLVNAIHFKGLWAAKFDRKLTVNDGQFFLSNGKMIHTPMMNNQGRYAIGYFSDFKLLKIPYASGTEDEQIYMAIIVPYAGDIKEYFAHFNANDFNRALDRTQVGYESRRISLPRFRIQSTHDKLVNTLNSLGIKNVFTDNTDFSRMSANNAKFKVSNVVQKAVIEVNEEGTEAAAATDFDLSPMPNMPPPPFNVNRPFIYAIVTENKHKLRNILFAGVVENPKV